MHFTTSAILPVPSFHLHLPAAFSFPKPILLMFSSTCSLHYILDHPCLRFYVYLMYNFVHQNIFLWSSQNMTIHLTLFAHGLGSKPTHPILLCPWKRHFTAHSPAWWSYQGVLNFSHISIKFQADSNIVASPKAGRGNCLLCVLAPPSLSY